MCKALGLIPGVEVRAGWVWGGEERGGGRRKRRKSNVNSKWTGKADTGNLKSWFRLGKQWIGWQTAHQWALWSEAAVVHLVTRPWWFGRLYVLREDQGGAQVQERAGEALATLPPMREALATGRNRRLARLKWCWPRMAALCVLESSLWQTLANHWATWHRPDSQESQLTRDPGKVSRHCCWTLWGWDRTHFSQSLDKKQEQTKQTKNKNNFLGWGRSDNIRIQLFQ